MIPTLSPFSVVAVQFEAREVYIGLPSSSSGINTLILNHKPWPVIPPGMHLDGKFLGFLNLSLLLKSLSDSSLLCHA